MGVASIIGLNFATIRINHRIELIAEMPASSSIAPLQPEKRGDFYYARSIGAFPLRSRCASCHAAAKPRRVLRSSAATLFLGCRFPPNLALPPREEVETSPQNKDALSRNDRNGASLLWKRPRFRTGFSATYLKKFLPRPILRNILNHPVLYYKGSAGEMRANTSVLPRKRRSAFTHSHYKSKGGIFLARTHLTIFRSNFSLTGDSLRSPVPIVLSFARRHVKRRKGNKRLFAHRYYLRAPCRRALHEGRLQNA